MHDSFPSDGNLMLSIEEWGYLSRKAERLWWKAEFTAMSGEISLNYAECNRIHLKANFTFGGQHGLSA
ncbi:hypothetical protein C3432_04315 [Citrobacter amalonaticus]|uniref:Uncharacterized protein n=1 Tax=Citrobacter amalonaticus TaxID=35703 RepID=A0A2S4S3S2_CITAM|nr:hypothetical protein C3432_04315 [Citrobacter amalonaticus]POT78066.1 hypothetical protein C3436_11985 [Citrobacter amalonaticus]POU68518.1 hypothetical protein C3430_05520 [Citrobacter amalonaticus]POV08122.1 hypothetical protein C3424_05535 [Citrobacter amalonaticus]